MTFSIKFEGVGRTDVIALAAPCTFGIIDSNAASIFIRFFHCQILLLLYLMITLSFQCSSKNIGHTRAKPYQPMTQSKTERYHRSLKNILFLEDYYSPSELEERIRLFVEYYNNQR
jgi:hypothetical protein